MPAERVGKLLAAAGVASRRGADALIASGRVTLDGAVVALGATADPSTATIAVDGRRVDLAGARARARVHLAAHKPPGVTSTVRDRHATATVLDLVPSELRPPGGRLYPVGRLDRDSEGLLLLTDDGPWSERVLHPRYGVEREYAVALRRPLDLEQVRQLAAGIPLDEGLATLGQMRPATRTETAVLAGLLDPPPPAGLAWYRATLAQGWRRQLRRMFAAVGAPVERLVRVRIGTLRLGELRAGDVRPLRPTEVRRLSGGG